MSDSEVAPSLDLDTLIAQNPKVDADQLREAQDLVEQLEQRGIRRPVYSIRSPYERYRPSSRRPDQRAAP